MEEWRKPLGEELKVGEVGRPEEGGGRGLVGLVDLHLVRCALRGRLQHSLVEMVMEGGLLDVDLVHKLEKQALGVVAKPENPKHGLRPYQA